jgi:hypothetical protein
MKIYISAVSSDTQYVSSLTSVYDMARRTGDDLFIEHRTRGDVARESLLEDFRKKKDFDAILCLDADQRHPKDMLERLRTDMETHNLDMVCAHYYRRDVGLIQSLCYDLTSDGTYPFLPLLDIPREGLHEIAITGLGCVLIHRRVLEAVWATLPKGQSPFAIGTMPDEANDHANWGSDFRFFILARRLGFKLWLDAGIESLHAVTVWLGHRVADKLMDYTKWADGSQDLFEERIKLHGMNIEAINQRNRILSARRKDMDVKALEVNAMREKATTDEEMQAAYNRAVEVSTAAFELDCRIKENNAWLEVLNKYPAILAPADLPNNVTWEKQDHSAEGTTPDEIAQIRGEMYRQNAADIVAELPELKGNGRR